MKKLTISEFEKACNESQTGENQSGKIKFYPVKNGKDGVLEVIKSHLLPEMGSKRDNVEKVVLVINIPIKSSEQRNSTLHGVYARFISPEIKSEGVKI